MPPVSRGLLKGSVNKTGSSLFGVGTGQEKQETPKKL